MSEFSLKKYKKTCDNTKVRVFIKYLYEKYGNSDSEDFDNKYFTQVDEEDMIESLRYYISKNGVTAQVTADNYITFTKDFFIKVLSSEYGIKNSLFINNDLLNHYVARAKEEIISRLKKSESKVSANDEQYEKLNNYINDYSNSLSFNDIYDELQKLRYGNLSYAKIYHRFVSIMPVKLVMKFALANKTIISLELKDLDMINNVIIVNGFKLPLDDELINLFELYLRIRQIVLHQQSKEESKLFIKPNGEPYITVSKDSNRDYDTDYASFFKIMKDCINTVSADLFASRRILEMLDRGVDISTVAKLSGRTNEKFSELQKNYSSDTGDRLQRFFNDDINIHKKLIIKKKGYLKCPFCGNEVEAISEEWVLVQFEYDGIKYLACRECKGKNGKYRI